jgi:small nuclear ribonucleoprotein (snRNP)-like protein
LNITVTTTNNNILIELDGRLRLFPIPGVLACLDGFMNIAMEQAEEYVGGQLKSQYADAFIRGNNVLFIRRKH